MEKVGLSITPKEFKQLSKWAENIYNTAVVIDRCLVVGVKRVCGLSFRKLCLLQRKLLRPLSTIRFVASQLEIEECYNLSPVVKHLRCDADLLNVFFIDREEELEN